jgi:sugar phosphate permease
MLASFMVILIKHQGWRAVYVTMGLTGISLGLLTFLVIKDPSKEPLPKEVESAEPEEPEEPEEPIHR